MVTPRQVKPCCMSSDSSRRQLAWAAAASITKSQKEKRCVVAISIASKSTACVVSITAKSSVQPSTASRDAAALRPVLRVSTAKESAWAGIRTSYCSMQNYL